MRRFAVLSALWLVAAGAQAQVYKCVDASGKTTYLQSPCPAGAKSAAISRTVPPAAAAPAAAPAAAGAADKAAKGAADKAAKASGPKTAAELDQDFRKRRQDEEKQRELEAQKLADARIRDENCRNARAQLVSMDAGIPQARINEQGERVFLDDTQVEAARTTMRQAVEQWCK